MPRLPLTTEFLVGYIAGKMEQTRKIVYKLEMEVELTPRELENMEAELREIHVKVQFQAKLIKDERVRPKMKEFQALMANAEARRANRLKGIKAAETDSPSELQFGQVDRQMLGDAPQQQVAQVSKEGDTLSIYASDNEEEFPLELLSVVQPTRSFQPTAFPSATEPVAGTSQQSDLRDQLNKGKTIGCYGVQIGNDEDRMASQPMEQTHGDAPMERTRNASQFRNVRVANRSRSNNNRMQIDDTASVASQASYVSSQQERFTVPVWGRAFPPIALSPPVQISRSDPAIIGISEIFVHPPRPANICPLCTGKHKLHRCTTMLRSGLLERWYRALRAGVCLNCLLRGHSSFRCMSVGNCGRCGVRHNSVLCPKNPNNLP